MSLHTLLTSWARRTNTEREILYWYGGEFTWAYRNRIYTDSDGSRWWAQAGELVSDNDAPNWAGEKAQPTPRIWTQPCPNWNIPWK